MLNRDFRDLLSTFSDAGVEYLVVGAYALAAHGIVRATNDLDVWVRPSRENARRVRAALLAFGAPAERFSEDDFVEPDAVIQFGIAPVRIDILTTISGVQFDEASKNRIEITLDGVKIPVLGRDQLIENKRASGRDKDFLDLERLEGQKPEPE